MKHDDLKRIAKNGDGKESVRSGYGEWIERTKRRERERKGRSREEKRREEEIKCSERLDEKPLEHEREGESKTERQHTPHCGKASERTLHDYRTYKPPLCP